MSKVGQRERATQQRVVQLFQQGLGYRYLGNLHDRENKNIEVGLLAQRKQGRGYLDSLIKRALRQLDSAAALGEGKKL